MIENAGVPTSFLERLESAPYGAYAIDLEQNIVFWNSQAERILGFVSQDVLGRKCYQVVRGFAVDGATPFCSRNCPAIVAANNGRIPPASHVRMQCASGQIKHVAVIPFITADQDDRTVLVHMFHEAPADKLSSEMALDFPLTPREVEVLSLLAQGIRPAEVAEQLFISVGTVRKHISNASEKLHAHGIISSVAAAQRHHLI